VVNYITRQPENTLEAQFRVGLANSVQEYIGSIAAGRKWDTGGFFLAYEYQKRTALRRTTVPELFNSDLSPYGGAPIRSFSSPANVQFTANGTAYGIPAGTTGGITLGQLSTTTNRQNAWKAADAVPSGERHAVVGTFRQHLGDSDHVQRRWLLAAQLCPEGRRPTATLTVPNTNPYSLCFSADNSATLIARPTATCWCHTTLNASFADECRL
jgi:iron complex outermembrane receptor protein